MKTGQSWLKPAIVGGSKGCLCCGAMHSALPAEAVIAVGFGSANCTKGTASVYDEQETPDGEDYKTCADMEALAAVDPDHDWRISFYAPLYEAVYQRHGPAHWVLIEKGQGFA
jgi:hypothetical protein